MKKVGTPQLYFQQSIFLIRYFSLSRKTLDLLLMVCFILGLLAPLVNHAQEFTGMGDLSCNYGDRACNRCVNNVEEQFAQLGSRGPSGRVSYRSEIGSPISGAPSGLGTLPEGGGHVQGFTRISGAGDHNWIAISTNGKSKGLRFLQLGDIIDSQGHRYVGSGVTRDNYWLNNPPPNNEAPPANRLVRSFQPTPPRHPGGTSAIGRIIAIPTYCPKWRICRGKVRFYEARLCPSTSTIMCPVFIQQKSTRFGIGQRKPKYVAVARLNTGHYFMLLNKTNRGRFDFFVSEGTTLNANTKWIGRGVRYRENFKNKNTYQNMTIVTECNSGQLHAIGLAQNKKNGKWTDNVVDLFKVVPRVRRGLIKPGLEFRSRINPLNLGRSCEMRGGASLYVTPTGNMIIYCSQGRTWDGQVSGIFSFSEVTHTDNLDYPQDSDGDIKVD